MTSSNSQVIDASAKIQSNTGAYKTVGDKFNVAYMGIIDAELVEVTPEDVSYKFYIVGKRNLHMNKITRADFLRWKKDIDWV
jgi:hypothetical protein